jgi:hypothetical protein
MIDYSCTSTTEPDVIVSRFRDRANFVMHALGLHAIMPMIAFRVDVASFCARIAIHLPAGFAPFREFARKTVRQAPICSV